MDDQAMLLFIKSFLGGFAVAMPLGPIGAICLRRVFQGRWRLGLATGLGAALADSLIATLALFGISLVLDSLAANAAWLRLLGGLFLIVFGLRMALKPALPPDHPEVIDISNAKRIGELTRAFGLGFSLTIVNPATFLAFLGVFAGFGIFAQESPDLLGGSLVILGVMAGASSWWALLNGGSALLRHRLPRRAIALVDAALGFGIAGFGVAALAYGLEILF